MTGVSYITNERNKRVAVQIDMKTLQQFEEHIEDLLDVIIAESRRDEKRIPIEKVKKMLKKKGKL
jgi:hypothetical protein